MIQQNQAGGNAVTAKRAAFEYNSLSQRTKLTRYQSTTSSNLVGSTEYAYDTVNRLSSLTHKQNTTVLAGYTYGYDGVSRLTSVTSTIEGLSSFTYDATSQVVGADHVVGGQADETYGFDLNGNRNTSGYTIATNNRTTADPGFTYAYDDQGNRTSRTETSTGKVTEYSWDHRNRLTTVRDRPSSGGSVVKQVDYAYDAFNRLVKRTYDADGAGAGAATSQFWVYDDGINAVLQFDGTAASDLTHRYLWTGVVDELMADETVGSGADTLYALGDHLGTIRDIANFNESTLATTVTNHRTYNSFGKLTAETNAAIDLIFGYTGKQLDEATGLQHNLFRWYDSGLGQWLSEDPMGFAAGDENLRRYVGNQTIQLVDPTGLQPPRDTGGWNVTPTTDGKVPKPFIKNRTTTPSTKADGPIVMVPLAPPGSSTTRETGPTMPYHPYVLPTTPTAPTAKQPQPPKSIDTSKAVWKDIAKIAAQSVQQTVRTNTTYAANSAIIYGVPGGGTGPCNHYAHILVANLIAWQAATKAPPLIFTYHQYGVNPALLPPVYGNNVLASGHIIVQVTVENRTAYYDGGSPARLWGNLGNDGGFVNRDTLKQYIKDGGLIPTAGERGW